MKIKIRNKGKITGCKKGENNAKFDKRMVEHVLKLHDMDGTKLVGVMD